MNPVQATPPQGLTYQELQRISTADINRQEKSFIFESMLGFRLMGLFSGIILQKIGLNQLSQYIFDVIGGTSGRLRKSLQEMNFQGNPLAEKRVVTREHLDKILQYSDSDAIKEMFQKMNFDQSVALKDYLGERNFKNLTEKTHSPTTDLWKRLFSIPKNTRSEAASLFREIKISKTPALKQAIEGQIAHIKNLGDRLLVARDFFYSLPENAPTTSVDGPKLLSIKGSERLVFSPSIQKAGTVLLDAFSHEEYDYEIAVDKPDIFLKAVQVLNGENVKFKDDEEIGKVLSCMHEFFNKFADSTIPIYKEELPELAKKSHSLYSYISKPNK